MSELFVLTHHFLSSPPLSSQNPSPGATKAAFPQLANTLMKELQDTHVGVHVLSPGMMLTELLLEGATTANKQAFNILCEHPETVAAFLVPRVRSAVSCGLNGTYTRWGWCGVGRGLRVFARQLVPPSKGGQ